MAIKKSLLMAGAVTTLGIAAIAGIGTVAADTNNSSLAEKIAQKFNINQDEVQTILDEHHEEMEAKHEQKLEERLSQAVANGTLTEDQKAKILAKIDELKAERESSRDSVREMSPEDRRTLKKERREELENWAEDNGLPKNSLRFLMSRHGHGGPGHHQE